MPGARSRPSWSEEAKGSLRFVRVLLVVSLLALTDVAAWLVFPPTVAGLPPGATRLDLQAQPSRLGARVVLGCLAAGFPDMRVARDVSALVFVRVGGAGGAESATGPGGRIDLIWPPGWSARLVDGRAELVDPEGAVVAREGDVIRGLGGGNGTVCLTIGARPVVEPNASR